MLKSIQNRNEAEIYECLSRDDSFIMNDLENLGPWHKYGGSIHQELQRITSLSIQKSVSEHQVDQLIETRRQTQQIQTVKRGSKDLSKIQVSKSPEENLLTKPITSNSKDMKNRSEIFKRQRSSQKKDIAEMMMKQKETQTISQKPEKQNVGFFVQCYPERNFLNSRQSISNFQTSKDYFEKIALKMMYGLNRQQEDDGSRQINSSKQTIQSSGNSQLMNVNSNSSGKSLGRKNYFYKKELKFNNSQLNLNQVIDNTMNSILKSQQNISKSKIPFHKILSKKTIISFASQNQLLEKEYQYARSRTNKMQRMVSS